MDIIYGLYDPRQPRRHTSIRYVGKTNNLTKRLRQHCQPRSIRINPGCYRNCWIAKLLADGVRPSAIILQRCVESSTWIEAEYRWVVKLRKKGCRLVNTSDTGRGGKSKGYTQPRRVRQKISRGMRGIRNCLGRTLTQVHRQRISAGMKRAYQRKPRCPLTDDVIQRIRRALAVGMCIYRVCARYKIHKRRVWAIRDGLLTEENKHEFRPTG